MRNGVRRIGPGFLQDPVEMLAGDRGALCSTAARLAYTAGVGTPTSFRRFSLGNLSKSRTEFRVVIVIGDHFVTRVIADAKSHYGERIDRE